MRPIALLALALVPALTACSPAAPPGPSRSSGECVWLFQQYDLALASMATPSRRSDQMPIPAAVQWQVAALQRGKCLTLSNDLTFAAAAGGPITDSGPAIPPTLIAAGVVTSMADEANTLTFFRDHAVPVRSIGRPGLGRRIYLGPFATQGAFDEARDLAFRAGFASPYPVPRI